MLDAAAEAGLDALPDSRLWRIGPAGLSRLRRGALRGAAEQVRALFNLHRDADKHPQPFTLTDAMPDVFPPAPEDAPDARREATRARVRARHREIQRTEQVARLTHRPRSG